jgi:hypothetical protein
MKISIILRISLFWVGLLWASTCLGQSDFGQGNIPLGSLPMQYTSSFAGSNGGPRISSFAGYGKAPYFKSYEWYSSYDQFLPVIRSGIGISAGLASQHSLQIPGIYYRPAYRTHSGNVSLAIAPKFSIQGKYTLSPSVDIRYAKSWDVPFGTDSLGIVTKIDASSIQSRIGILFNTPKFYIGYSQYLINKVFYNNASQNRQDYIINSYLQAGYTFQRSSTAKFSFTPQVVFQLTHSKVVKQTSIGLESFNLNFRYKNFIWGLNSVGMQLGGYIFGAGSSNGEIDLKELRDGSIQVGWQNEKIRFVLSNNVSSLDRKDVYHITSLSFRYLIPSKLQQKYTIPGISY